MRATGDPITSGHGYCEELDIFMLGALSPSVPLQLRTRSISREGDTVIVGAVDLVDCAVSAVGKEFGGSCASRFFPFSL